MCLHSRNLPWTTITRNFYGGLTESLHQRRHWDRPWNLVVGPEVNPPTGGLTPEQDEAEPISRGALAWQTPLLLSSRASTIMLFGNSVSQHSRCCLPPPGPEPPPSPHKGSDRLMSKPLSSLSCWLFLLWVRHHCRGCIATYQTLSTMRTEPSGIIGRNDEL